MKWKINVNLIRSDDLKNEEQNNKYNCYNGS